MSQASGEKPIVTPQTQAQQEVKTITMDQLPKQTTVQLLGIPKVVDIIYMPENSVPPMVVGGREVKIAIGVPANREVDFRWAFWFANLRIQFPTAVIIADNKYGIASSREAIFQQFMSLPMLTHLLFVDADIVLPSFAIQTLVLDNVDIVSGVYWNSLNTGDAAWVNEIPLDIKQFNANNNNVGNPVIQVDKTGMGCCLISKRVGQLLSTEEKPYFYYKIGDGNAQMSEDFYFYQKLNKLGIKPFVDLRVQCQHIRNVLQNADGGIVL